MIRDNFKIKLKKSKRIKKTCSRNWDINSSFKIQKVWWIIKKYQIGKYKFIEFE